MRRPADGYVLAALAALAALAGCSIFLSPSDTQCQSDADCAQLPGTICASGGCLAPGSPRPGSSPADAGGVEHCTSTQECLSQHLNANWICRHSDQRCVPLLSPDCPTVLGNYVSDEAIFVGALVPLGGGDVSTGFALRNTLRMGVTEVGAGLPRAGASTARRPLVAVVCDESTNPERATRHLVDTIGVPAILGPVFGASTMQVARAGTLASGRLLVSPAAGNDLDTLVPRSLVWRTCPSDTLQASAMAYAVRDLLEPKIKAAFGVPKIRVAVIRKTDVYGDELRAKLLGSLEMNGSRATSDANAPYLTDVDYGNPEDPGGADPALKYSAAVGAVVSATHLPNLVVLIGHTRAIPNVMKAIEKNWPPTDAHKPYYLLSNALQVRELLTLVGETDGLNRRVFGTSPGLAPVSPSNLSGFLLRYRHRFGDTYPPETFGNAQMYDALYMLAYGIAAADSGDLAGSTISAGMKRVVAKGDAKTLDVGPDGIDEAFATLAAGAPLKLRGASGPLALDEASGDVTSDVQVWCVVPDASTQRPVFFASGQFYRAGGQKLDGALLAPCNL